MDKILLIGAGGHARACIDIIETESQFEIAGLVEKEGCVADDNLEYPTIGTDNDLQEFRLHYCNALITVGQIKSPETRKKLYQLLKELNFNLPVIISPQAYVSKHAQIGEGSIIMHGAIINANAKVGKNCIINNKSLIEHDAVIGNHCHIATGAIINGEVSVGNETFIGSGAITKQCISIGNNCIVGAGVILKSDVRPNQVIKN
ncbi:MAG: acetyltransferase [Candidatus Marinimicrobia bacterium]|jgi:sugar O-acyltransferase (sialic acid O-acetyltransferase NeuD family)|nr:acetyltransferase [Candidatus Neomarinimicrobiota bacterium]